MIKKRKLPWFMKRRLACPECGWTAHKSADLNDDKFFNLVNTKSGFTCPECQSHFTYHDFWQEHEEKWSYKATL